MHEEVGAVKKYVDLHIHSTYSDGECSVREILEKAHEKGLSAVSITDHDNIDGYPSALEIGSELGIEVITGTELSCEIDGVDVHVLGYFVDLENSTFRNKLKELKEARYIRAKKIVRNLNLEGVDLRFETVLKCAGQGAIGRPHIATAMLNEELVYSFKEAFERYIGYDSAAYVEKMKMTPQEVFTLILDAGGIPVLAHPGITNIDNRIPEFVRDGLGGIEVFHSEHSPAAKRFYQNYCQKHSLAMTGGSDFHSQTQTRAVIGMPKVPFNILEKLQEKRAQLQNNRL